MTRGWTYQEGLLARRRLFFSETEMSFECCDLLAREAIRLWEGDFALTQKGRAPSSGDCEGGCDTSLRRRLLEESWPGIVLGRLPDSHDRGNSVYVLVVEKMPQSAIGATAHWERVGLLTINHATFKSEILERKELRLG
jgi:hypothetical protein